MVVRAGIATNEHELQANMETMLTSSFDLMNQFRDQPAEWRMDCGGMYHVWCRQASHQQQSTIILILKRTAIVIKEEYQRLCSILDTWTCAVNII